MKTDPRRALLGLAQQDAITEDAIRAAYWREVRRAGAGGDLAALRAAKTSLLHDAGVRLPSRRGGR